VRRLLSLTVALTLGLAAAAPARDLASYVHPLVGTLAPGFVFPGSDVPFGMVQNSPDTEGPLVYGGYNAHDALIRGFSLVHLSGPGVAKAGDLPFMPWTGAGGLLTPPADPSRYAVPYSHAGERAEAGYYRVRLGNGTLVELTSSTHAAMQRYAYPPGADAFLVVDPHHHNDGATRAGGFGVTGPQEISGFTQTDHYPVYFVARFDRPILAHGPTWLRFGAGQTVTMRIGISFVDADGARRNLDTEAPSSTSFDAMRSAARAAWNRELARLQVSGGEPGQKTTFYTALYHALLHPNVFTDVDGRYRGFDDRIHVADGRTQYANFSSWDTYKAENQLEALVEPGRYADMLRSLLADAQEGGNLPRWGEEDYDAAHMSGDPAIPMIADGVCRGLIGGDEAQQLYAQAVALVARRQPEYAALGYLPVDRYSSGTGTTLEYGVADFSLALMAEALGRPADAARWLTSSLTYRNELDPQTKWIRPRNVDGSWYANFDPAHDETGFQEGNSWQYSWLVPQDPRGLFDRMGGDAAAVARLDHLFAAPAELQTKATLFGTYYRLDQWAPGNEHDLGAPFLYAFARQPAKAQAELRAAQLVYRPTRDGLPGNDDLGGLSGWYVLSAIGLSPFTPGAPLLMVGSPQFERTTIAVGRHGHFTIEAPGASLLVKYVQDAALNGRPLSRAWLPARALRAGGSLRVRMGAQPSQWATAANAVPPSASDAPLSAFGCAAR